MMLGMNRRVSGAGISLGGEAAENPLGNGSERRLPRWSVMLGRASVRAVLCYEISVRNNSPGAQGSRTEVRVFYFAYAQPW